MGLINTFTKRDMEIFSLMIYEKSVELRGAMGAVTNCTLDAAFVARMSLLNRQAHPFENNWPTPPQIYGLAIESLPGLGMKFRLSNKVNNLQAEFEFIDHVTIRQPEKMLCFANGVDFNYYDETLTLEEVRGVVNAGLKP